MSRVLPRYGTNSNVPQSKCDCISSCIDADQMGESFPDIASLNVVGSLQSSVSMASEVEKSAHMLYFDCNIDSWSLSEAGIEAARFPFSSVIASNWAPMFPGALFSSSGELGSSSDMSPPALLSVSLSPLLSSSLIGSTEASSSSVNSFCC